MLYEDKFKSISLFNNEGAMIFIIHVFQSDISDTSGRHSPPS